MEPLRATYGQSTVIHEKWCEVYRRNPRQLRFDEQIYSWLFDRLQPQGTWLDAGCGSGERTVMLACRAAEVVAIDLSPDMLERARKTAAECGIEHRVQFHCGALEEMSPELKYGHVHCRGVLMHIPDWRRALANLCRGVGTGYVVLFESNRWSFEAALVRLLRRFRRGRAVMVASDGGLEFWSKVDGQPFLLRMANPAALEDELRANGVRPLFRQSVALFDPLRLPSRLRRFVLAVNRLWFAFNLPFACGLLIVGKRD